MTKAQLFTKYVNRGARPRDQALSLGLASYTKFDDSSFDMLMIGLAPYGHYTFSDGSHAEVVRVSGRTYAYITTQFKTSPPKPEAPARRHKRFSENTKPKAEPKAQPYANTSLSDLLD